MTMQKYHYQGWEDYEYRRPMTKREEMRMQESIEQAMIERFKMFASSRDCYVSVGEHKGNGLWCVGWYEASPETVGVMTPKAAGAERLEDALKQAERRIKKAFPIRFGIKITRDHAANVYTATCDAMGLVCEAETLADLFQAMADVAPDLIEENGVEL